MIESQLSTRARQRAGPAILAIAVAALLCLWPLSGTGADSPVVAAASSLKFALTDIAGAFERETGHRIRVSYGSSGNFRRQIARGAPFQVFLSADESYVDALANSGHALDGGTVYAVGRLSLFYPSGSEVIPDPRLRSLATLLEHGALRRFAIANPDHAPYGRAARQALVRAGLWDQVQAHLVMGENAAQATQFAMSGSTQGGIIPHSLSTVGNVAERGESALIPADWHDPVRQRMVLLKGAGKTAREFYGFMQGQTARALLRRHGFFPPDSP